MSPRRLEECQKQVADSPHNLIFKKIFILQDHQLHHCENEHVQSVSPLEPTQEELKRNLARNLKILEHHRKLHVQRAVDVYY